MNLDKEKEAFSARLRELVGEGRGAIAKLAELTHQSHQVATAWYNGTSLPKFEGIIQIAEGLGCDPGWLLTGEGKPFPGKESGGQYEPDVGAGLSKEDLAAYIKERKPIPVVGTASANPNATIEWEEIEHEVTEFGPVIAIRVEDDSMEPLARQGQFVLAIPDADLHDGDLAVLRIRRKGVVFKRIYYNKTANTFELQSANPVKPQPSMTVKPGDITKQYRVVGVKFE